ncbi:MAG: PEP-CTERM sorting domain-containing protein [Phycisphaerae bacterium]|nr:PEP-CTERM sorting domain-containing protein [Phycisphaerae bacterium]
MKKLTMIMAVVGLILVVSGTAGAETTYGGNVTPLWNLGVGQPTGNFVVDDNGDIQTALRATGRYTGALAPVNTEGRYFAFTGTSTDGQGGPPLPGVATWNFCFHVNVDTSVSVVADPVTGLVVHFEAPLLTLDDVNLFLIVDDNPAVGVSSEVVVDLKLAAEAAAGGVIDWTPYVGMRGAENLGFEWLALAAAAQGKTWTFDPEVAGEYEFSLVVFDKGMPNPLCWTDMKVTVVPEPATMSLLVLGGIGVLIRKRRK